MYIHESGGGYGEWDFRLFEVQDDRHVTLVGLDTMNGGAKLAVYGTVHRHHCPDAELYHGFDAPEWLRKAFRRGEPITAVLDYLLEQYGPTHPWLYEAVDTVTRALNSQPKSATKRRSSARPHLPLDGTLA